MLSLKEKTDESVEKSVKKVTKNEERGLGFGILGIVLALVIVSITYSVVVILLGTEGLIPRIMLAPQALFAISVLGYAFYKIFK